MKQEQAPLSSQTPQTLWVSLRSAAEKLAGEDAVFAPFLTDTILSAAHLGDAMGRLLSQKLQTPHFPAPVFRDAYAALWLRGADALGGKIVRDMQTVLANDPAAHDALRPFLFFKGFHALQCHRLAHDLWHHGRQPLALLVQNRVSDLFGVDIHPAARIGCGIMFDHATGIVIGETAVVEDDVLFWHGVTLGGRAFAPEDRHPKVRQGAQIGAGATILGNIEIGAGAKIAAGSVVVKSVPAGATAAGTPARVI
ncbi:MAG TPA: serine O-acetyltransferase [Alphaproteobacteria bacterium]|nr:serine O-acetyltransferase [Rhodospirillaceae bacterium]HRJ66268.1 serine O-acetyltransferase [Alphaproteobacteria bacterium]